MLEVELNLLTMVLKSYDKLKILHGIIREGSGVTRITTKKKKHYFEVE